MSAAACSVVRAGEVFVAQTAHYVIETPSAAAEKLVRAGVFLVAVACRDIFHTFPAAACQAV